mmetsp:Transcript_1480/g.1640  ORF Transcript_1480/g.1640 Transcript_1480/m.1640 type:complete len:245 (-) Transcript_1480:279-1013(-)
MSATEATHLKNITPSIGDSDTSDEMVIVKGNNAYQHPFLIVAGSLLAFLVCIVVAGPSSGQYLKSSTPADMAQGTGSLSKNEMHSNEDAFGDGLFDADPCDGPYYSSSYAAPHEDSVGSYDCNLAYFDNLEGLEAFCSRVRCDKSKKCPELGFTTLLDRTILPPNPLGYTCAESYIKPNKPVPPCCETGSWVTCNYERCENEYTKDVVCPGFDDEYDYCNGFEDCFRDLCDCDEARNGICKWAN